MESNSTNRNRIFSLKITIKRLISVLLICSLVGMSGCAKDGNISMPDLSEIKWGDYWENITKSFEGVPGWFEDQYDSLKGMVKQKKTPGNSTISRTTLEGCAIGATGDVIKEILIKYDVIDNNALYHLPIGTLVGCSAGWLLNERRKEYKKEADFYDGQIAESKKHNASIKQLNEELDKEITRNNEKIARLKKLKKDKAKQKELADKEFKRVEENTDLAEKNLQMAKKEKEVQEEVLKEMRQNPKENEQRISKLEKEIDTMTKQIDDLYALVKEMNNQEDAIGQYTS